MKVNLKFLSLSISFVFLLFLNMCSQSQNEIISPDEIASQLSEDTDFIKSVMAQQALHNLMLEGKVDLTKIANPDEFIQAIKGQKSKEEVFELIQRQEFDGAQEFATLLLENIEHMTRAVNRFPQLENMEKESSSRIIQDAMKLTKERLGY